MKRPRFRKHQIEALKLTENRDRVAYYMGCGTGKTFVACEQLLRYNNDYNLVIVQKSKVSDWIEHFRTYTDLDVIDYTKKNAKIGTGIIVINYELTWRRKELKTLKNFTLLLDESSKIQHETAKQTKFILSLKPKNVILASGTPCAGRYENLYSQIKLLGVPISKRAYWDRYVIYETINSMDKQFKLVTGYKNVEELKANLRNVGAVFMLSDDVLDLPSITEQTIKITSTPEYRKFVKNRIVFVGDKEFVGDTTLNQLLRERQLCGSYNENKLATLSDILESTDDRMIIFYQFAEDFQKLAQICIKLKKPTSYVNGSGRNLTQYNQHNNSVTLIQYQAGAHGLNLQLANKMIFFDPPLSCEQYSQAKARIHRLGQEKPCLYWYLTVENSVEEKIYARLNIGVDYTLRLFEEDELKRK